METALRESMLTGHGYVGAEHLLLALAASGGRAADVLRSLDVDPSTVRTAVLAELGRAA